MSSKAKTIARRLLKQNRGTPSIPARPWRTIAREDYGDKIPNGTLSRFALSDGEWLPKDEYQYLLGLKRERKATHSQPKDLFDMATDTLRWKLTHREPMPPLSQQREREIKKMYRVQRVGAL